jgi:hypothetical protein
LNFIRCCSSRHRDLPLTAEKVLAALKKEIG